MCSLISGIENKTKQMNNKTNTDSVETKIKLMVSRGEDGKEMDEKGEEKIVNDTVISLHDDRWLLDLVCSHLRYINVEWLYCTTETSIILYPNYT